MIRVSPSLFAGQRLGRFKRLVNLATIRVVKLSFRDSERRSAPQFHIKKQSGAIFDVLFGRLIRF